MSSVPIKILVLSGPTGVGKTAIGSLLAAMLNGEIISCDSVQVYKELIIGSNKDLELSIPQHLINIVSWKDGFTNADFYALCLQKMKEVDRRGMVPLLVGGTGFYTKWIIEGKPSCPPPSKETLLQVENMVNGCSWEDSIKILESFDPIYASSLYKNDTYRLKRAIANYLQTSRPMTSFLPNKSTCPIEKMFDFRCFYLSKDRLSLALSIDLRCEQMIKKGLLKEVGELWDDGLTKDCSAGRAIGYSDTLDLIQELWDLYAEKEDFSKDIMGFFNGKEIISKFKKFIEKFKSASRQYSRRQDTWHREIGFQWIDSDFFKDRFQNECEQDSPTLMAQYIASAFNLSRVEWDSNEELKEIHQGSLALRWTDSVRESMRTYQKTVELKSAPSFELDSICSKELFEQLGPIFRKKANTN